MAKNDLLLDDSFLFDMTEEQQQQELSFLNKETKNQDGIYRPSLELGDPKTGYKSTLRFVRNLTRDGKIGPAAIEKYVHYVDFKNYPELSGFYDCEKNHKDKCELCTMFFKLYKSNNQADVEKSKLIGRQGKWYSYVEILEDEFQKDLVGKIMVFPYGFQIKEKIEAERRGEYGDICNIFDFASGKDFRLIIKEKTRINGRPIPTYESSAFLTSSPIKVWVEKQNKFVEAKLENGKITDPKWQTKIKEVLTTRDANVNLEDHMSKEWTDEERMKVHKIVSILNGEDFDMAEESISKSSKKPVSVDAAFDDESMDDFFDFDEPKSSNDDDDLL